MVNYQNSKIYRIVDNTNGNVYYGSTCENTLALRLSKHKADYKQYLNRNHNFTTSFDILKNNNYEIILVESYPCNNKDELHARERFYIENNECVNKYIPNRTNKEWCERNKEVIAEKTKQPYTCVCGSVYRIDGKSHHFKTKKHQRYLEQNKV